MKDTLRSYENSLAKFPLEQRGLKLFDQWSLKDILAHLSGWNILTVADMQRTLAGESVDKWINEPAEMDEFNADQVAMRAEVLWEAVLEEFISTTKALIEMYDNLTLEQWQMQFGPDTDSTPLRSVEIDIDHMRQHLQEIQRIYIWNNDRELYNFKGHFNGTVMDAFMAGFPNRALNLFINETIPLGLYYATQIPAQLEIAGVNVRKLFLEVRQTLLTHHEPSENLPAFSEEEKKLWAEVRAEADKEA